MSRDFQALGYPLATATTPCGSRHHLVEVYPHPALLVLVDADRRVPYKVSKSNTYWKNTSVQERIRNLLGVFQMIQETLHQIIPAANVHLPQVDEVPSLAYLKRFEDALDALICGWVGIEYLNGNARPVGDDTAAIWLPMERMEC